MSPRLLPALFVILAASTASAGELGFPISCTPGTDCFVQQYPDTDAGADAADPFCGGATYDGHKGTDVRILSLADMATPFPVIAVADGTVLRTRTDMPDSLVQTDADAEAVRDRECGNGIVVDHGGGLQAQYCHLAEGSIDVFPGQAVGKGDRLGDVGASGLAQFPHVHVQFTRDGVLVDPTTGRPLAEGCSPGPDPANTLWDDSVAPVFFAERSQLLAAGFTDGAIEHAGLVVGGIPPEPTAASSALVAWAWLIDLEQGDVITVALDGPSGPIAENTLDPLERDKATYSAYTGKRMAVAPGTYRMQIRVERDGTAVIDEARSLTVN